MNVIVYHIYCVGDYQNIVKSQIDRLKSSGLYDWCDKMEVSCVDITDKYLGIDDIFQGMDKVNMFKTNRNGFEYWGIKKVWDLSQEHDGKVFYFHSKGVSNTYKNLQSTEISEWKIEGIKIWRDALEYHLIDNFKLCVRDLDEYDTCGLTNNGNWFWGNFWWANLSYVRQNPEPVHGDRWYFESWLHFARHYKAKEYRHFEWNPYFTNLPLEAYVNEDFFKNKPIQILSGLFGTNGIQLDEGYPNDIPVSQIDVTQMIIENFNSHNGELINLRVDIDVMGDPIHGMRKFLTVIIKIGENNYRITYNEGFNFNLKFK